MTAAATTHPTPDIVARAAEWAAELDSDQISGATREACEAWCLEDPLHRLTLDRMRGLDARFDRLEPRDRGALRLALDRRGRGGVGQHKALLGIGAAVLLSMGVLVAQTDAFRGLFPDYATTRGEQRTLALKDGSTAILDTDAAMNFRVAGDQRIATLFRGQVFVKVAPDRAAPFTVRSQHGEATALGTAYIVRDEGHATTVTVVESRVRVCPGRRTEVTACLDLATGQRARMSSGRLVKLGAVDPREAVAWTQGWLEVNDRPVAEVLTELNRYRDVPIRFDAATLRGVRVTGSYPLEDGDRALLAIAETKGLRISHTSAGVTVSPGG